MNLKREKILSILRRLERGGLFEADGPTSVFLRPSAQLAVRVEGERVTVRQSRLPFSRPMVFTRAELREEERG